MSVRSYKVTAIVTLVAGLVLSGCATTEGYGRAHYPGDYGYGYGYPSGGPYGPPGHYKGRPGKKGDKHYHGKHHNKRPTASRPGKPSHVGQRPGQGTHKPKPKPVTPSRPSNDKWKAWEGKGGDWSRLPERKQERR